MTAIRAGADPGNPGQPLQVMPWREIRKIRDRDLIAICEHVCVIPSVP
jgi:hypothetical protein